MQHPYEPPAQWVPNGGHSLSLILLFPVYLWPRAWHCHPLWLQPHPVRHPPLLLVPYIVSLPASWALHFLPVQSRPGGLLHLRSLPSSCVASLHRILHCLCRSLVSPPPPQPRKDLLLAPPLGPDSTLCKAVADLFCPVPLNTEVIRACTWLYLSPFPLMRSRKPALFGEMEGERHSISQEDKAQEKGDQNSRKTELPITMASTLLDLNFQKIWKGFIGGV